MTQHIATIFTFLTVFVRLNEGLLDPRLLVWISVGGFLTGYATWELLECSSNHNTASMTNSEPFITIQPTGLETMY